MTDSARMKAGVTPAVSHCADASAKRKTGRFKARKVARIAKNPAAAVNSVNRVAGGSIARRRKHDSMKVHDWFWARDDIAKPASDVPGREKHRFYKTSAPAEHAEQSEPSEGSSTGAKRADADLSAERDESGWSAGSGERSDSESASASESPRRSGDKKTSHGPDRGAGSSGKVNRDATLYAYVKLQAAGISSEHELELFLREDNDASRIAKDVGKTFADNAFATLSGAYEGKGMLGLFADSYDKKNKNYPQGSHPGIFRRGAIAHNALDTAVMGFNGIFGQNAVKSVPQDLCNALAIAVRAINDSGADEETRNAAIEKVKADFMCLRTINPVITVQAILLNDKVKGRNITECAKLIQNVANKVETGDKMSVHPNIKKRLDQGVEAELFASFDRFCNAVIKRADKSVVNAAVNG